MYISDTILSSMSALRVKFSSARFASSANDVYMNVNVFGTEVVSMLHILKGYFLNY
jgi:hypothetical protein